MGIIQSTPSSLSAASLSSRLVSMYMESQEEAVVPRRPLYKREQELHHDCKCPICLDLLYEPQVTECRHVFCRECLRNCMRQSEFCPVCRRAGIKPKPLTGRQMTKLNNEIVNCDQCSWSGRYMHWQHHVEECGGQVHIESGTSIERLCSWLTENKPGIVTRLEVQKILMSNNVGATLGRIIPVAHQRVTLVFARKAGTRPLVTYLTMEICADTEGITWCATYTAPQVHGTVSEILLYDSPSLDDDGLLGYLTSYNRQYNFVSFNCVTFVQEIIALAGCRQCVPKRGETGPRSYSQSLISFLSALDAHGEIPILDDVTSTSRKWLQALQRQLRSKDRELAITTVRVLEYEECDTHRMALRPTVDIVNRTVHILGVQKEVPLDSRFNKRPVLVLEIRDVKHSQTMCFLCIEFRSHGGLLHRAVATPEPCAHVSRTRFPISKLIGFLDGVKDKKYDSLTWSGWEFAEDLLRTCDPELNASFNEPVVVAMGQ